MRYCICGKVILRQTEKGHREREYCSDACRQRACRARNKEKHALSRIRKEAEERMWNALDQTIHRESWQDELEQQKQLIMHLLEELTFREEINTALVQHVESLENRLAEKEGEIAYWKTVLERQSKKRGKSSPIGHLSDYMGMRR
jgi:hypothetical protein